MAQIDGKVKIESLVSGRMRARMDKTHRQKGKMASVASDLNKLDCVKDVSANPQTGSLLISFKPGVNHLKDIVDLFEEAGNTIKFGSQIAEIISEAAEGDLFEDPDALEEILGWVGSREVKHSNNAHHVAGLLTLLAILAIKVYGRIQE